MRYLNGVIAVMCALVVSASIADNRSDQMNPNNDAYWQSRGHDSRPNDWDSYYDQLNNHSNQLNPNNDAYWQSRGHDSRPNDWHETISSYYSAYESYDVNSQYNFYDNANTQTPILSGESTGVGSTDRPMSNMRVEFDFYNHSAKVITRLHALGDSIGWADLFDSHGFPKDQHEGLAVVHRGDICISTLAYTGNNVTVYSRHIDYEPKYKRTLIQECAGLYGIAIELSSAEKKLTKKQLINSVWRQLQDIEYVPPKKNVNLSLHENRTPIFGIRGKWHVLMLDTEQKVLYIFNDRDRLEKLISTRSLVTTNTRQSLSTK